MPPPIVILGYSEAAMFVNRNPPPQIGAIVSIHGPREHGIDLPRPPRLDLTFDDVECTDASNLKNIETTLRRKRWAEQTGKEEIPPCAADVESIIEFAKSIADIEHPVLFHCGGGMSRAPAAALICLTVWNRPGSESTCIQQVLQIRRGSVPHAGLIRFADALLGRDGKLIESVKRAIGQ